MPKIVAREFEMSVRRPAKTSTERSREYRERKRALKKTKPKPKTSAERCRDYRARKRARQNEKNQESQLQSLPGHALMRQKWIKIIRTQRRENDWSPNKHSKICSQHFSTNDLYETKKKLCRLKKTAVPLIEKFDENDPEDPDEDSDKDHDTSDDDLLDPGDQSTNTNKKRAATDTESAGKSAKRKRFEINDIEIDYDNIDVFGQQIVFLLKRLPRKLCRELQESIVSLVRTRTEEHESKTKAAPMPSTSSGTKVVDVLSQIVFTPTLVTIPNINEEVSVNEEVTIKEEPKDEEESTSNEPIQVKNLNKTQIWKSKKLPTSKIKTFNTPMTVPIELVGSLDCVKQEPLDPEETNDDTAQEQYNEDSQLTFSDPLKTDIKIEIVETDLLQEANSRANSDK